MMEDCEQDQLTLIGIAALAFVIADLSHEALGHGTAAYFAGAKQIVLAYTYLSSDVQSRWISAAGPLVNFIEGLLALLGLRWFRMPASATFFVFLLVSFNLLDAAAYLVYSGVLNSGDLGILIAGQPHLRAIRIAMVLTGLSFYWVSTVIGGRELSRFKLPRSTLTITAYFAPLGLNCGAALLNPLGLKYFLISALPATLGSNAGLFLMTNLASRFAKDVPSVCVERRNGWIMAGFLAAFMFIAFLGPGLTLRH